MIVDVALEKEVLLPISVVVPCFNNAVFLTECIDSINCGVQPSEIIIIDDNSTDNSVAVAKNLSLVYKNIKLIERKENGGAATARYDGFKVAKNDWIALLDADDYIEDNALLNAYNKAKEQQADVCIWNLWRFDKNKQWPQIIFNESDFPKTGRKSLLATIGKWDIHPLGVAKKQLYLDAYSSFESTNIYLMNADELITRIIFSKAGKVVFTDSKYFYRMNVNSTTLKKSHKHLSVIHSDIWLLHFIRSYNEIDPSSIAKGLIAKIWGFHQERRYYGRKIVEKEIKLAVSAINELAPPRKWIWRTPKYLLAYLYISLIYRVDASSSKSSEI